MKVIDLMPRYTNAWKYTIPILKRYDPWGESIWSFYKSYSAQDRILMVRKIDCNNAYPGSYFFDNDSYIFVMIVNLLVGIVYVAMIVYYAIIFLFKSSIQRIILDCKSIIFPMFVIIWNEMHVKRWYNFESLIVTISLLLIRLV